MRSTRRSLKATILSLLLTPFATSHSVFADDDFPEDYDVKARVVRVSLINGEVSLKRNGNSDWERARLNFPLVEGDTVSTDPRSRLEIQVDARNFVRLEEKTILRIVALRDEGVALSIVEGTASVRLAKFDRDHEYFEVDAPKVTIAFEKEGLYRIDVPNEGHIRLTARDGGRARIYSETSGFALRDGRTAELIADGSNEGDWELLTAASNDVWDNWVDDRERYLAQRLNYDNKYYDNYIWGAEELDAYGSWADSQDYGWIWRPDVTIINNYPDWAPYRHGYWTWCPPYGWTWIGYEPWGWAPYHYGRWVYYDNYWAWCPHSYYSRHRSWWRSALVAFHFSFGSGVSWYPLSYYHRDPRSQNYTNQERLRPLGREELANLRRVNPAYLRAVTSVSARDFGAEGGKFRAADEAVARRVMSGEPLRGDLPIRPAGAGDRASGKQSERITIARPARLAPTVELPARSTGAATRRPGVALDDELRRSRVFNGREPRPQIPMENSGSGLTERTTDTPPTGAVVRPARPVTLPLDSPDGMSRPREGSDNSNERSSRPGQANPRRNDSGNPDANNPLARERRPEATVPSQPSPADNAAPTESPDRPERVEPRSDLPTRTHRNEEPSDRPVDRPQRHDRTEPAPGRSESPSHREAPQHYESPSEPTRQDPPPQRSEPVRNDPPPRSDPPHSDLNQRRNDLKLERRNDLNQRRNDLNQRRNDLNRRLSDLNRRLSDLNRRLSDLNRRLSDLNRRLSDLNRRLSDLNRRLSDLNLGPHLNRRLSDLNRRLSDLNRRLSDLNRRLSNLNRRLSDLNRRLSDLNRQGPNVIGR